MVKKEKTFLEKLKGDFGKLILGSIILNILFLIFGIIIFMNVNLTIEVVGVIIGIYFVVFGLFDIFEYLSKNIAPIFKYKIFGAVVSILLGLFIIFNPFKIVKIITFTLGIYLVVISILKLFTTFNLKKYGYDGWLVMLVTSFVLLIFGVFIAVNPMAAMDLVQVAAIFIILSSILEICNLIMIYSKAKDIVKLFKEEK
jgi:uncharacterized membrane protein HdeD (DUF308 family)